MLLPIAPAVSEAVAAGMPLAVVGVEQLLVGGFIEYVYRKGQTSVFKISKWCF